MRRTAAGRATPDRGRPGRLRWLGWGVAAGAVLLGVALVTSGLGAPVLPLFDGLAPPLPYRWVNPPPELAGTNLPPQGGRQRIPLAGAETFTVATGDGQAVASGRTDAFAPDGQRAVVLEVVPLDPATVGPPPAGQVFDGNAYRVEGSYVPSGEPARVTGTVTILLRYPIAAQRLLRWTGRGWQEVPADIIPGTLQIFATVDRLGTFVAAGTGHRPSGVSALTYVAYALAGLAVAASAAALYVRARARRRPAPRGRRGRPARGGPPARGSRPARRGPPRR